jgi:hypothetical protein
MTEHETTVRVLEKNETVLALGLTSASGPMYVISRASQKFLCRNGIEIGLADDLVSVEYLRETRGGKLVIIGSSKYGSIVCFAGREKRYTHINHLFFDYDGCPVFLGIRQIVHHQRTFTVKGSVELESTGPKIPYSDHNGHPIYINGREGKLILVSDTSRLNVSAENCFEVTQGPDGCFLFAASRNTQSFVIWGKKESVPYLSVIKVVLAANGKPLSVVKCDENARAVVYEGVAYKLHAPVVNCNILDHAIAPDGKPVFRGIHDDMHESIVHGEVAGLVFDKVSCPQVRGNEIRYLAFDNKTGRIVTVSRRISV